MIKTFIQFINENKMFDLIDNAIKSNRNIIILNSDKNALNLVQYYLKKMRKNFIEFENLQTVYEPEFSKLIKKGADYLLFHNIDNLMFSGSKVVPETIQNSKIPFIILSAKTDKNEIPKIFKNYDIIEHHNIKAVHEKSFEESELNRLMDLVNRHKKIYLKDISLSATPKGNWMVYDNNKETGIIVPGNIVSDSTIDKYGLKYYGDLTESKLKKGDEVEFDDKSIYKTASEVGMNYDDYYLLVKFSKPKNTARIKTGYGDILDVPLDSIRLVTEETLLESNADKFIDNQANLEKNLKDHNTTPAKLKAVLQEVFDRGYGAAETNWASVRPQIKALGRPGAYIAWGIARVKAFLKKGTTYKTTDSDLVKKL